MAVTPNYNLNLPAQGQHGWKDLLNQNFDKIDVEIKNNSDKIGDLSSITESDLVSAIQADRSSLADIAINVKAFGAKGDGISDDTQYIQNAINYGNNIYFPDGTYKITSTINVGSNKHLSGNVNSKIVADFEATAFTHTDDGINSNIEFKSLKFDGITNRNNRKFIFIGGDGFKVVECEFINCSNAVYMNNPSNFIISDNMFKSCIVGLKSEYGGSYGFVKNNVFKNNQYHGISFISDMEIVDITNNHVEGNGGTGIIFNGGIKSRFKIINNTVINNGQSYGQAGFSDTLCEGLNNHGLIDSVISKNIIKGNGGAGIDVDGTNTNAETYRAENVSITDNIIINNGLLKLNGGIVVWGSKNITISNNLLEGNYSYHILIGGGSALVPSRPCKNFRIINNTICGLNGNSPSQNSAIMLHNYEEISICNNSFIQNDIGTGWAAISIASGEDTAKKNLAIYDNDFSSWVKVNPYILFYGLSTIKTKSDIYETKEFDLSETADTQYILLKEHNKSCWLKSVKAVYTESSSADVGVNITIKGKVKTTATWVDYTTEASKSVGSVSACTVLRNGSIHYDETMLIISCIGGKVGTGKVKLLLEISYDIPMYY